MTRFHATLNSCASRSFSTFPLIDISDSHTRNRRVLLQRFVQEKRLPLKPDPGLFRKAVQENASPHPIDVHYLVKQARKINKRVNILNPSHYLSKKCFPEWRGELGAALVIDPAAV